MPVDTTLTPDAARKYACEAYIFAYPLVLNYRTMYAQAIKGDAAFGKWLHLGVSSPDDTDIVTPNNDTPYSYAWLDLRAEPWVLTMPAIEPARYYTAQWDDLWGYVLDNPGSVEDGNGGGNYVLAAPGWAGSLPPGIKRVITGESVFLGTLTRTQLVGGMSGLPAVEAIQQAYCLQPLSTFAGVPAPAPAHSIAWPAWSEGDEASEKYWHYVGLLLPFTAPDPADAPMYEKLRAIGIVAGRDWAGSELDADLRSAIAQGMADAIEQLASEGAKPTIDSAKLFGSRKRVGTDYLSRALGVYVGIFGNVKEQAIYVPVPMDTQGAPLDGSRHAYEVVFPKGETPPVEFF